VHSEHFILVNMSGLFFIAAERKLTGTGSAREARKNGLIPVVVYGFGENHKFTISYKEFYQEYSKGNITTRSAELKEREDVYQTIVKDVQTDPVLGTPIHVDFQLVRDETHVKISARIKVINQEKAPGIKKGGTLNLVNRKIELICLPKSIPQNIEVDIKSLEIGSNIRVNDIIMPAGTERVSQDNYPILSIVGRIKETDETKEETVTTKDIE
jgi:large subunit ribosomal protein L25